MAEGQVMGINYGFNKLRFLNPVTAGSRLRGRFTMSAVTQRNATDLLRETALTIEIEGAKTPALVADWLGLSVFEAE
jgi:acyl dehydratase